MKQNYKDEYNDVKVKVIINDCNSITEAVLKDPIIAKSGNRYTIAGYDGDKEVSIWFSSDLIQF